MAARRALVAVPILRNGQICAELVEADVIEVIG